MNHIAALDLPGYLVMARKTLGQSAPRTVSNTLLMGHKRLIISKALAYNETQRIIRRLTHLKGLTTRFGLG
jgi:hypothetical protein